MTRAVPLRAVPACVLLGVLALALPVPALAGRGHVRASFAQPPGEAGCFMQSDDADERGGCAYARGLLGADAVAVSPDGRNVYVAARGPDHLLSVGSEGVATFARSARTGRLRQLGCITNDGTDGDPASDGVCRDGDALGASNALIVTPDGRNVYVASATSGLALFARDADTGELTQIGCIRDFVTEGRCADGTAMPRTTALASSPDGRHIYVTSRISRSVAIFERALDGGLTQVGCVSENGTDGACADGTALEAPTAVAVSPRGGSVYVTSGKPGGSVVTFRRDPDTGLLTQTGCIVQDAGASAICTDGRGLEDASGVAVAPDGGHVYVTAIDSAAVTTFDRDGASGALTQTGCLLDGDGGLEERRCGGGRNLSYASAVAVTGDGGRVYVSSAGASAMQWYSRDRESGRLKQGECFIEGDDYEDEEADEDEEGGRSEPPACSPARGLYGAKHLALSGDDRNVYVASDTGSALAVFGVESTAAKGRRSRTRRPR